MKTSKSRYQIGVILLLLAGTIAFSLPVNGNVLEVLPIEDFVSTGDKGGPFTPLEKQYQLHNTGQITLYWGVDWSETWLNADPEWGVLDPNAIVVVTVCLTPEAYLLAGGVYTDTLMFSVMGTSEEHTRGVNLTVTATPGILQVTPVEDFDSSGEPGGPFTPSYKEYQLTNIGGSSLDWGVSKTANWLDLAPSPTWGNLAPGQSTTITVSINTQADLLGEGVYNDTVTFTDITTQQDQMRQVTLTIERLGWIWVNPESFDITAKKGTVRVETLTIGNDGDQNLIFTLRSRYAASSRQSASKTKSAQIDSRHETDVNHNFTVLGETPYKAGELLVRFDVENNNQLRSLPGKNQLLTAQGGGTVTREFEIVPGLTVIQLPPDMTVEEALQIYNQTEGILYAEANYEVKALSTFPDDPRLNDLWGMHNTGQSGGTNDADIDAPEAWDISTGSNDIIVAVIDTGIDYNHSDLAANMWINPGEIPGNGLDDDGNGYVDDIYGYDFCNNDADPWDDHYHGTHCAGTVGAVGDNNIGVAGVCWNVKLMAVKFLDSGGSGWTSDAVLSVQYATQMGVKVMSNSWGGGAYNQSLKDAIDAAGAAGIMFVAAAGNNGSNNDTYPHYPSSYNSESLIAVLATDKYDNKSSFSNYGPVSVDLGAPGSSILSCEPGGGYQYLNGTSMATPHVAGACALLWSISPNLTYSEIRDILLETVDPALSGLCVSGGRLNLYQATLQTSVPWLELVPEEGTVTPDGTIDISVNIDAITLVLGIYEAEIVIFSNDPYEPTLVVPLTLTILPDDLAVTPDTDFVTTGIKGGPFEPVCMNYNLRNSGNAPISWTATEAVDWLELSSSSGTLDPNETYEVQVCISPAAYGFDPNICEAVLTFENLDSGSIKHRTAKLTILPPDTFTESFDAGDNDLENQMLTFIPDGSSAYYSMCRSEAEGWPTDPARGNNVSLGDDDYAEIVLSDGKEITFYGHAYDRFYIGSNGYLTFGAGDTEYLATTTNHFALPRIAALFVDLTPEKSENISFKQLDDRVAVTYQKVPLYGNKTAQNSFQVEMFFADGMIRIIYADLAATGGIAGLSEGYGLPPSFAQSDLSAYIVCCTCGDFDGDSWVGLLDLMKFSSYWLDDSCGVPGWCEKTDINRSGDVNLIDWSRFAQNWLYYSATYAWSDPTELIQWNGPAGYGLQPHLSPDELTMYYGRRTTENKWEMVEAYRDYPDGPFSSERIATELGEAFGPWVSPDQLRMYYTVELSADERVINFAERNNTSEPWTFVRTLSELHLTDTKCSIS